MWHERGQVMFLDNEWQLIAGGLGWGLTNNPPAFPEYFFHVARISKELKGKYGIELSLLAFFNRQGTSNEAKGNLVSFLLEKGFRAWLVANEINCDPSSYSKKKELPCKNQRKSVFGL